MNRPHFCEVCAESTSTRDKMADATMAAVPNLLERALSHGHNIKEV